MEKGFAATHAFQPQAAVGAKRIHSLDHCGIRHLDSPATPGTSPRRSGGVGTCWLYRDLLVLANPGRCLLFFALGLAEGTDVRGRPYSAHTSVLLTGGKLHRAVRMAHVAAVELVPITRSPFAAASKTAEAV